MVEFLREAARSILTWLQVVDMVETVLHKVVHLGVSGAANTTEQIFLFGCHIVVYLI